MGGDASLRTASALAHVRSRSVRGFPPSRRAGCPPSRPTASSRRSAGRLHTYSEHGASREADREVFQRSHGPRRCLPRSNDRIACRSHHPHDRPRFPSLPSPQPPSGSLCDTRVILPPLISAETEPGLPPSEANLSHRPGCASELESHDEFYSLDSGADKMEPIQSSLDLALGSPLESLRELLLGST